MIDQCEDPNSFDIALRALVSVEPWRDCLPLEQSNAFSDTVKLLRKSLDSWGYDIEMEYVVDQTLKQSVVQQLQSLPMMSNVEQIKLPGGYLKTIHGMWWSVSIVAGRHSY
jgi:hypothetical protein